MSSRRPVRGSRRRLGVLLMGTSMLAALSIGVVGPAIAQEASEPVPFETIEQIALFAAPNTDAVPNTLTTSFPPPVVCVLRPELCTPDTAPIRDPITGVIVAVDESAEPSPVQPVAAETLPVTFTAGNIQYQDGLTFSLPPVPDGDKIDSFVVTLGQIQPSYAGDSPLFRQAVLAAVAGAGSRDPAVFQAEFTKALESAPTSQPQIGIEVCPFKSPYPIVPNDGPNEDGTYENEPAEPGSAAPPLAASDNAIPQQDEDGDNLPEPNVDCLFGASGTYDEATAVWSFDLTFALQAWIDGTLDNNGVLIRPTGAPNLAFGDPDTSFNAQVTLDATSAAYMLATSPPPPPIEPLEPLPPAPVVTTAEPAPAPGQSAAPVTTTTTTGGSTPITSSSGGFSSGNAPVTTQDEGPLTAAPVQDAPVVAEETVASPQEIAAPFVPVESGYYWLLWLLIPIFLMGMYLTSGALTSEELVDDETRRQGAMTRLLQNQQPTGFTRTV